MATAPHSTYAVTIATDSPHPHRVFINRIVSTFMASNLSPQRIKRQQHPSPHPHRQQYEEAEAPPGGYVPNSVYATRTQYRNQSYPTFSTSNATQPAAPIQSPYQHNLYSVQNHISRRYDSTDELLSPSDGGLYRRPPDPNAHQPSPLQHRHGGSVDLLDVDLSPAKRAESQLPGETSDDNYRTYPGPSRSFTEHNSGNSTWYVPDTSYEGMDLSGVESPTSTVTTKYQNYVEVSKPFEMSDFYKYSEKLRRQRVNESPGYHSLGRSTHTSSPYNSPHESERPRPHITSKLMKVLVLLLRSA
ncbi:hypothetical protein CAPTEDRAFT_207600 [Capitella teleta]|uniref:Uncharacterized protein n=1 Tax=Capitella teleta TaxID=283909 RepID=R7TX57_CAPTE|nr:hypothetical protein CAPTEDRAFT_207600 [Capitella teleta]|eukprot:ELT98508.1 hypothetical protein CAPTEDRAFT_207600 [Capitella teleta]